MFKKGDIVECVYEGENWDIKLGKTYEVLSTSSDSKWVKVFLPQAKNQTYLSSRFKLVETKMSDLQKKREELAKAIEVIRASNSKWIFYADKSITCFRDSNKELLVPPTHRPVSIAKKFYPDPKQDEIERIELEMRKLADDLAKLKG